MSYVIIIKCELVEISRKKLGWELVDCVDG